HYATSSVFSFCGTTRINERTVSEQVAQVRVILKAQGQPIGPYDLWIAATALQHNLIMVTANQREFSRVPNIKIENWRGPISRA
ncbi:MAG: hypothetical protein DCF15_13310, partial [Phormidesmis priestleyi]